MRFVKTLKRKDNVTDAETQSIRRSHSDLLTHTAAGIESSVVGIIGVVLLDAELDKETQQLKQALLVEAHRLRQIAIALTSR